MERVDCPGFVLGRDKSAFDLLFPVLHSSRSENSGDVGGRDVAAIGFRILEDIRSIHQHDICNRRWYSYGVSTSGRARRGHVLVARVAGAGVLGSSDGSRGGGAG